ESDEAEQQRRSGQAIHEPTGRRRRDPGARERDDLAEEEQPVVAVAQRAKHEGHAAGAHVWHAPPSRTVEDASAVVEASLPRRARVARGPAPATIRVYPGQRESTGEG